MKEANTIGVIPTVNFSFKVSNISKLDEIYSPEYLVQGIPWQVQVCKTARDGKDSLGIYLHCAKEEYEENWSHAAFAKFKLLSFNNNTNPIQCSTDPYMFDDSGDGIGEQSLISWQDLFDSKKNYVKNDTIKLDISIAAADLEENTRSKITFENVDTCCEEDCFTTYRLSITNIKHLMGVRTPKFNMRKLPWALTVFKSSSTSLNVLLEPKVSVDKFSCKTKMWIRLISSKGDEKSIEEADNETFESAKKIFVVEVVSWDELFKPENGFVNNNSITMEVEIKMSKPEVVIDDQNDRATSSDCDAKPKKMECSICFEAIRNQDVSSTKCGHLFCKGCITNSVKAHGKCPLCNAVATENDLRPVYLPFTN
ncbi:uncharacterized protein LOC129565943 [Sitodiplosis mosellana]|uniref:uncharacterized protein LOC129565943 n=1 Tax=Sitodiplosis mosellana TaxID=263140 RepID=UPI00244427CA|nr:uncharacterized protein LOC129565943 [Sitodiplosis mosellana]